MEVDICGCMICGCPVSIASVESGWWSEFRISNFMTGVGRAPRNSRFYHAPADPLKRWDDDDRVPELDATIPDMDQPQHERVHKFLVHESCWKLLCRFFEPQNVPLDRLVAICESLALTEESGNVSWDHSYNDLYETWNKWAPWYQVSEAPSIEYFTRTQARADPFNVQNPGPELLSNPFTSHQVIRKMPLRDCFWGLSWELRETLAVCLPTQDALSLRCVSSAFLPLLGSQTFWASRFDPGGERDFFFEARNCKMPQNWLQLYRSTSFRQCLPGLGNRRRIWPLLQNLCQLLLLQHDDTSSISKVTLKAHQSQWATVTGLIETDEVRDECRIHKRNLALVPPDVVQIGTSLVNAGETGFITGISFMSAKGDIVRLGYRSKGNESFVRVSRLTGFLLAMAPKGLKGLKVMDKGIASQWIGFPLDTPVTERLARFESIEAVEVGVDGYKVVSFAAAGPPVKLLASPQSLQRSTSLWYPSVPSLDLHLYKMTPTLRSRFSGFRAFGWVSFGGFKGADLQHLTEIRLNRMMRNGLASIEFHYCQDERPIKSIEFGNYDCVPLSKSLRLSIDGRGGEYIEKVFTSIKRPLRQPADELYERDRLYSLLVNISSLIETQSLTLLDHHESREISTLQTTTRMERGCFFGEQGSFPGIETIGVISEAVNDVSPKITEP
ncbi:hypothetical protein MYU51_021387 [Penicillium brevicompactum]